MLIDFKNYSPRHTSVTDATLVASGYQICKKTYVARLLCRLVGVV